MSVSVACLRTQFFYVVRVCSVSADKVQTMVSADKTVCVRVTLVRERHFWTKNPTRFIVYRFGDFLKNLILGTELASFSDKKTRTHSSAL